MEVEQNQAPENNAPIIQTNDSILIEDVPDFSFSDKNLRKGFIFKVYAILTIELLVTAILCLIAYNFLAVQNFQKENIWLVFVCLGISVVLLYALGCYKVVARSVPINYILLSVFTICDAYIMLVNQIIYLCIL